MSLFGAFSLAVLMFIVILLTLAMLIDCWRRANLEMTTKFALTQAYTLSWTVLFLNGLVFLIGQALFALFLGWVTARSLRGMNHNGDYPTPTS